MAKNSKSQLDYIRDYFIVNSDKDLETTKIKGIIENKYLELQNKKMISDEELIKEFPDEIFVPTNVSEQSMNNKFNSILTKLSKNIKKEII